MKSITALIAAVMLAGSASAASAAYTYSVDSAPSIYFEELPTVGR